MAKNTNTPLISAIYDSFVGNESSIKRFLSRYLFDSEDIEDIAQETFLRAYKVTQGREIDHPKAYLFKVARSIALKELSRKSRQLTDYLEDTVDSDIDSNVSLEDEASAHQKVKLYCDAIAELPSQCRKVFLMRKVQAMSHKDIAKELDITTSAVEKHIALGVERCKKYIERQERVNEHLPDISFKKNDPNTMSWDR